LTPARRTSPSSVTAAAPTSTTAEGAGLTA
jgi:hypothetical protein